MDDIIWNIEQAIGYAEEESGCEDILKALESILFDAKKLAEAKEEAESEYWKDEMKLENELYERWA